MRKSHLKGCQSPSHYFFLGKYACVLCWAPADRNVHLSVRYGELDVFLVLGSGVPSRGRGQRLQQDGEGRLPHETAPRQGQARRARFGGAV